MVPNTTAAGAYELRLFSNNSYTKLATSNGITVQPPPAANLTAAPASLYASQSVTATWSSILAPTANDWIGLYAVGAADSAVIAWQYAGGSASGSVPIQVPNTTVAGAYELRLFANNSYTKLATSNGITVQPPPPATLSATGSASPGGSVTANWASILAPTANDWIGLYVPGAADSAVLSWHYTTGVAAGNVPVSLPANLAQGNYELRLFANNSYTKLATSATFGVGVKTLSFIHVDHLNTPRLIADDVGTTVWKWDQQEPFGNSVPNQDPGNTGTAFEFPLRFPGQYFDKETNLADNWFRTYDPSIGRYPQSDPIGLRGGINTYAYVASAPLSYIDPQGLQFAIPSGGAAGAMGGPGGFSGRSSEDKAVSRTGSRELDEALEAGGRSRPWSLTGTRSKSPAKENCDDDDGDDCKQVASDWELKQAGIDAHEVKKGLGSVRLFEICKCKSGGFAVKRKGCQGPIIFRL